MTSEEAAGEISAGVRDPGSDHGYEDKNNVVGTLRDQAEVGHRGADPESHEQEGEQRPESPCFGLSRKPEKGPGQAQNPAGENPLYAIRDRE
jgi:hypothetical protein